MKKWQLVGTTVLGASVLLGACGGGNNGGSGEGKDVSGKVKHSPLIDPWFCPLH